MHILLQAFVLGAAGGAVPGAMLTVLLLSTLQGGFAAGVRTFVSVMVSELCIVGALLLIAFQLPLGETFFSVVGIAGGLVLFYFAWNISKLRSIREDPGAVLFTPPKIFALQLTNSTLYIFWTAICFPLIGELARLWTLPVAATSFFVIFEIGWAIMTFSIMLLFLFSRTTLTNERIMHKVFFVLALIFVVLGIKMIATSILHFI